MDIINVKNTTNRYERKYLISRELANSIAKYIEKEFFGIKNLQEIRLHMEDDLIYLDFIGLEDRE